MISIEEIDRTILELEERDASYAVCEKLAYLYIVRDHFQPIARQELEVGGTEFLNKCNAKSAAAVLKVLSVHMEVLKAIYPKEYEKLLQQIDDID
jgi:hypothetical protein